MLDDSDFAFTYLRPIAVLMGWALAMWAGWRLRDWFERRREKRRSCASSLAQAPQPESKRKLQKP